MLLHNEIIVFVLQERLYIFKKRILASEYIKKQKEKYNEAKDFP